jgi:hypothetical protein
MFALSALIGIYSYGIFTLGVLGLLTRNNIIGLTLSWLFISIFYFKDKIKLHLIKLNKYEFFILLLIIFQALINLIGALGPELGFDALWYHLTLPKIWLSEHLIRYLPGAVYKYSVMPKLTETLYAAAISLGNNTLAKLIHYLFGLLILIPLYELSRKFLNRTFSLLVLLFFYTNLIVGWESTTAYVDLVRTFFEVLALKLFISNKYTHSAITLGLAICVKTISLGSLPIFVILLLLRKKTWLFAIRYTLLALLIPMPWFLLASFNTGNPLHPMFSPLYPPDNISLNLKDFWTYFTQNPDPISPLYIITAPLLLIKFTKKWGRGVSEIFLFGFLSLFVWFITPRTGGGRFILPYLPVFSLVAIVIINSLKDIFLKNFLIFLTLTLALTSITYRFIANLKYIPVILGSETEQQFLISHLNYSAGDYYDTDNYLTQKLTKEDNLLVAGINNLYYLPTQIRFTHLSTLPDNYLLSNFNYILVRYPDSDFYPGNNWQIIHMSPITKTILYQKY